LQDPDSQIPGREPPPKPYRVNAINPLLQAVQRQIRKLMNDVADDLAEGTAKDFPEYRHGVGMIAGLAFAERVLLDIDEQVVRSEEE
jgi:hypothetical protein